MSRADVFARYAQIYQKSRAREIVPDGPYVKQFTDIPRLGLDISVFFKARDSDAPCQIHLGTRIPKELVLLEGFNETEASAYLTKTIISDFKDIEYVRAVISAKRLLNKQEQRIEFLKKCQSIIDLLIKKARNAVFAGDLAPFQLDRQVKTLEVFLKRDLGMDEISVEAASIPFNVAEPLYVSLTGGDIIVIGDELSVPHGVFYFVGGIGYVFDKNVGAVSKERVFRPAADLTAQGIDQAYTERMISRVTEDFQNKVHSIIFADVWKKSKVRPVGVNFNGDLLIKAEETSQLWNGVFEVYLKPPKP